MFCLPQKYKDFAVWLHIFILGIGPKPKGREIPHSMLAVQLLSSLYKSNPNGIFTAENKVKLSFTSYCQLNYTLHFHFSRVFYFWNFST